MLSRSNELYFIPSDTGKPAYDGFMVDGPSRSLYAFQMTTSPTHDAKLPQSSLVLV